MLRAFVLFLAILFFPIWAGAQIEGSAERYRFEPGDKLIYQDALDRCPVGEFLPEWKIVSGGYECARFNDRMWIRPLEHGTTLYLLLQNPLPEEFSLELTVHSFEAGRPMVRFALHPEDVLSRLERGDAYAAGDMQIIAGIIGVGDPSVFGAKDKVAGNIEGRWDFSRVIPHGQDHQIAVQVRRGQVRFFVDGQRVGHKPFRPEKSPRILTLYFRRVVSDPKPFAEAPVLVRGIRIATYSTTEATPQAERDLIRELGAEETKEGLKITLSESILFDFGKWTLKPEAKTTLEKVAHLANLNEGPVHVWGHTDDVGSEQFNLVLSELRAHVVALALARLGVDPKRLEPKGFGETRPIVSNDTDENRTRNRRVEVILGKQQ